MGLMDIINGMQNGPRGQTAAPSASGGMSPLTMGLLALLAYKAFKGSGSPLGSIFGGKASAAPNVPSRSGSAQAPGSGGGLGGLLGGLLTGGAAGGILSGGLSELMRRLQQNGQGDVAKSWVATGPNQAIAPDELAQAAGVDTLDELIKHSGMPREQVLAELARSLPGTVDQLTPDGRLPTEHEESRLM